jgi:hypothetical protein
MGFTPTEAQKVLKGVDYPADGDELAEHARENGADDELVDALRGVDEADGPTGVMTQLRERLGTDDQRS